LTDTINDGINNAKARIRSIVERIERLQAEIDALNADKAEIYKDAKSDGWDLRALKALIAERRKREKLGDEAMDEQDELLKIYREAMQG
jgi:uncharacterized protein (UPF0335 family)